MPKPKRPPVATVAVTVNLPVTQLIALDQWIVRSGKPMSRQEAIRHILSKELSVTHNFMLHPPRTSHS